MDQSDRFPELKRWLLAANRWLDSWIGRLYIASAAAAVYVFAYQHHGARPGASTIHPIGWFGWWDQGQYLKCAASLAHGSLTQDTYWYPLGYPALGAILYRVWPEHSFLPPNLVLVTGIALLFYQICRKFVTPFESVLILAAFVFSYHGTLSLSLVEPWNTIPTHFLIYAVIFLVGLREPSRKSIFAATICVGLTYLCRPPDAVCVGLIVTVAVFRLRGSKEKIKTGLVALAILLFFVAGVALMNRLVFSAWRTPYEVTSANIGFGSYPLAEKFFWLVIDGKPLFHLDDSALLVHFPWLVLLPPGFVYFIRRCQWAAVGLLLSIGATYGLYLAYNDFWPGNVFLFHLIHYLVWTLPILALITYVGLREAWKDRLGRWSFSLMVPVVILACFITLHQKVSGRILPAALSEPKVAKVGPHVSWILFRESSRLPESRIDERDLEQFRDYVRPRRSSGSIILLSTAARQRTITIDPRATPDLRTIDYGTLRWRWQWPPRPFAKVAQPPRVTVIGKIEGVDFTGPDGTPDGQPDQVIQLDGERALLARIFFWDVETTDSRGHWVSAQNDNGWWPIKVIPSTETMPNERQVRLRLCFPDYGDFERTSAFVLRGTDIDGSLLIDQTIQK